MGNYKVLGGEWGEGWQPGQVINLDNEAAMVRLRLGHIEIANEDKPTTPTTDVAPTPSVKPEIAPETTEAPSVDETLVESVPDVPSAPQEVVAETPSVEEEPVAEETFETKVPEVKRDPETGECLECHSKGRHKVTCKSSSFSLAKAEAEVQS